MKILTILLPLSLILSGCVTDQRDSGGKGMQLSQAVEIEFSRTDLDIPLFLESDIASVSQEIRDNSGPIDNYNLGEKGSIRSQRISSFFSDRSQNSLGSLEDFREQLAQVTDNRTIADNQITPVTHNDNKRPIGFKAVFSLGKNKCLFGFSGYRMRGLTVYSNDKGNADTVIRTLVCGDDAFIKATETMLANVTKVEDRATYEAALKKSGS